MFKKANGTALITSIVIIAASLLVFAFCFADFSVCKTSWLSEIRTVDGTALTDDASVTLILDRTRNTVSSDSESSGITDTESAPIDGIWVNLGYAYTYSQDNTVKIYFDFKTTDVDGYRRRVEKNIKINAGGEQYGWIRIFNADEDNGGEINYSRVTIHTPYIFEFGEVAFTDENGGIINISKLESETTTNNTGKYICDEQNNFTSGTSRKYVISSAEEKLLSAATSFIHGGSVADKGTMPLGVVITAVGVLLFGANALGLRIMQFLFGVGLILCFYRLSRKLYKNEFISIIGVVLLASGGLIVAAAGIGFADITAAFFAFLSYSFAVDYFISGYNFKNRKKSVFQILMAGLTFSAAVAVKFTYVYTISGLAAVFIFALRKQYFQYRNEEKEAKGLIKEDIYRFYRRNAITVSYVMPLCLIVLPVLFLFITYCAVYFRYEHIYGGGVFGVMFSDLSGMLTYKTSDSRSNIFGWLIGLGSEKLSENNYLFMNIAVNVIALISLIFTTVIMIAGKYNVKIRKIRAAVYNKYKIIIAMFLAAFLPLMFTYNTNVLTDFVFADIIYIMMITLAFTAINKIIKNEKKYKITVCVLTAVCLTLFGFGFVGYLGISVPEAAAKILYMWQIK